MQPRQESIALAARTFLESFRYQRSLWDRLESNTLPSAVECLMYHYAYGKPALGRSAEDDQFIQTLLAVVMEHVGDNAHAKKAIRSVIEAHAAGSERAHLVA
jgi:hypothetical protein